MEYTTEQLCDLAMKLIEEAERKGAKLRLLGGVAVYLSSPQAAARPELSRHYQDLDFAVDKRGSRVLPAVFASQGWEPDRYFNALHGRTRLLFFYQGEIQADVFIEVFEQCHRLEFEPRLGENPATLSLADLLLTKLQIHQLNAKDVKDIYTLLLDHEARAHGGADQINLDTITSLAGQDWGWYTTLHDNLEFLDQSVEKYVDGQDSAQVHSRVEELRRAIENTPKSLRWQMRSRIGKRMLWYDEPEEVRI
ncbi:MAG: hypothetical protein M1281_15645 [Chloroflexi bacterium]|nr:hypothetical protein [Chloroflexota bacterium]